MDEELFDLSTERAQSGRGPFLPGPGPAPAPPTGESDGLSAAGGASRLGPAPNDWPVWSGFVVLLAALVIAAVGGLIVDIPAILLGVKISSVHTPPGIEFADTVVQDVAFVLTAVLFAQIGGRKVRSWQFGYRATKAWRATRLTVTTIVVFLVFSVVWEAALNVTEKDTKLLEALGTNETTLLLVLSALLTTVIAPICEETGILFGGVHFGSAPVEDLVPLGVLGFALCLLYRRTGSLYPCIALHSLNNSFAFGELEGWGWWIPLVMVGALGAIWTIALIFRRIGVISGEAPEAAVASSAYDQR
jgi:membrane protease YdiL (CAAX protease family)